MKIIYILSLVLCVNSMKFLKSANSVYNLLHSFLSQPELRFKAKDDSIVEDNPINNKNEIAVSNNLKDNQANISESSRLVNQSTYSPNDNYNKTDSNVEEVYIVPTSKKCNENWDYLKKGSDWECICKEGAQQSPINLPLKEQAVQINEKPIFDYPTISSTAQVSALDESIVEGEQISIVYDRGAIRIYHPNMGKIIGYNAEVFIAEEISFHTPSEHTIADESFDLEMQVVHFGRSKGDIANQVVLCFLFKKYPKAFNKLLDQLDFFNLPNPTEKRKDIIQDFSIANVLLNSDDGNASVLEPFSFYKYEGSLTTPPCSERTVYYVASEPIPLSLTVIELFKEAIKEPQTDPNTGMPIYTISDEKVENNRAPQPLNDRIVYYFDPKSFGLESYKPKVKKIKPQGHYEKILHDATEYFYVKGKDPSGIPGALIVSEKEVDNSNNNLV